jgi:hypothetical protein
MRKLIRELVQETQRMPSVDERVKVLKAALLSSECDEQELEETVTALRAAFRAHVKERDGRASNERCDFCASDESRVRILLTSANTCICDGCVWTAVDAMRRNYGYLARVRRMLARLWLRWHDH